MRRAFAWTLLFLFSCALAAPLFASDADAHLPACCRRDGKHHCAMNMVAAASNGFAIKQVSERCPYFPRSTAALQNQTFSPGFRQVFASSLIAVPNCIAQTEARYRLAWSRSRQKRGPPTILL